MVVLRGDLTFFAMSCGEPTPGLRRPVRQGWLVDLDERGLEVIESLVRRTLAPTLWGAPGGGAEGGDHRGLVTWGTPNGGTDLSRLRISLFSLEVTFLPCWGGLF